MLSVSQYFVFFIMSVTISDDDEVLIITPPLPYAIKSNKLETPRPLSKMTQLLNSPFYSAQLTFNSYVYMSCAVKKTYSQVFSTNITGESAPSFFSQQSEAKNMADFDVSDAISMTTGPKCLRIAADQGSFLSPLHFHGPWFFKKLF